jgi:hypothetical protein
VHRRQVARRIDRDSRRGQRDTIDSAVKTKSGDSLSQDLEGG